MARLGHYHLHLRATVNGGRPSLPIGQAAQGVYQPPLAFHRGNRPGAFNQGVLHIYAGTGVQHQDPPRRVPARGERSDAIG